MTAEIRNKYIEAGYQSTINLSEKDAMKRVVDTENRAKKNSTDIEFEWIALGCLSAYSDIVEKNKQ